MNRFAESFQVRPFRKSDLAVAWELSRAAGWNQTTEDWRRQYEMDPSGCFVACVAGETIGTVTSCRYGGVAWVAMMLVAEPWRRKGVGRALMGRVVEHLETSHVRTIRLDATSLGQPLYESLGFRADFQLTRFRMRIYERSSQPSKMNPLLEQMVRMDTSAYGYDRQHLIRWLLSMPGALALSSGEGKSFLMARPGHIATFIGPCVCETDKDATQLISTAVKACPPGMVFIDVPQPNVNAIQFVERLGFVADRSLQRMTRGESQVENTLKIYATSGPENG